MLPNNPEVTDNNTEGTPSPSRSVHASYLWFKGQNDLHTPFEDGGNKDPPGEPAMEEHQTLWQASIDEYNDPLEFGPEIPSSTARVTKVFSEKSLKKLTSVTKRWQMPKFLLIVTFSYLNVPTNKFLSHCQVPI